MGGINVDENSCLTKVMGVLAECWRNSANILSPILHGYLYVLATGEIINPLGSPVPIGKSGEPMAMQNILNRKKVKQRMVSIEKDVINSFFMLSMDTTLSETSPQVKANKHNLRVLGYPRESWRQTDKAVACPLGDNARVKHKIIR